MAVPSTKGRRRCSNHFSRTIKDSPQATQWTQAHRDYCKIKMVLVIRLSGKRHPRWLCQWKKLRMVFFQWSIHSSWWRRTIWTACKHSNSSDQLVWWLPRPISKTQIQDRVPYHFQITSTRTIRGLIRSRSSSSTKTLWTKSLAVTRRTMPTLSSSKSK